MERRETFKDPLVRVRVSRVRFPKMCPVCGLETNRVTKVVTTHNSTKFLSRGAMAHYDRKLLGIPSPDIRTFHVYVCEEHDLGDGGIMRLRAASTFYAALAVCMLVFAVMFIGSDLSNGRPLTIWTALFFTFVGATMALAFVAFRPYGIETAFKIVGFDYDLLHMWLQLHNPVYRNAMLNENGTDAELVSWIVRRGP